MKQRFIFLTSLFLGTNLFAGSMGPIVENNFSGFYAGLGTGFISLFTSDKFTVQRPGFGTIRSGEDKSTNTAVLFSGQVGYGAMFHQKTYLGGKASVYYSPLEDTKQIAYAAARGPFELASGQDTVTRSLKPIYNIDAVLGYEFLPNLLPFVEAGVSFANIKHKFAFEGALTNLRNGIVSNYSGATTLDSYKTGFNVGLGANYLIYQNWMVSGELVYHDLGKPNLNFTNVSALGEVATHDREELSQSVSLLASVSYLFPV